jgi:hypothetical protein
MADDLQADQTPGFKVGEKKTLDEYHKLGKAHLGLILQSCQYDILCCLE